MYLTIPQFFARMVNHSLDHPAVRNIREQTGEPRKVTFKELDRMAARLACGLAAMGIGKGVPMKEGITLVDRPFLKDEHDGHQAPPLQRRKLCIQRSTNFLRKRLPPTGRT